MTTTKILQLIHIKEIVPLLEAKGYVTLGSTWLHISPMNTNRKEQNMRERERERERGMQRKMKLKKLKS